MKKSVVLLWCYCLFVSFCIGQTKYGVSKNDITSQKCYPQLKELGRHGGVARVELTIRDDKNALVEGVKGGLGCWNGTKDEGVSDKNGQLVLSATAFVDGNYALKKDGYYPTYGIFKFEAPDVPFGFFERRHWKPIVKEMVLKKKRNPIPMYAHSLYNKPIPAFGNPLGFDLQVADWVVPYGEGVCADVTITVEAKEVSFGRKIYQKVVEVKFDFPNKYDGVQICDADRWSDFISTYSVDLTKNFQRQLVLLPGETDYDWFDHNKYLVFRVRSEVSPSGDLIQCHYGKIYPTFWFSRDQFWIKSILFNPTPNDTNLEFDPEQNLTDKNSYSGTTQKQSTP